MIPRYFLVAFSAGFVAAYLSVVLIGLFAKAVSQDYSVATIGSYHFDRSKNYNEHNDGLGLEWKHSDEWSTMAGIYKNSFRRNTAYLLEGYTPLRLLGARIGVAAGGATGYRHNVDLFVAGVAMAEWRGVGANLVFAPSAIALQVKWRFR